MDLESDLSDISNKLEETTGSGTNIHAGLLEAKKMLDADTDVDSNRKYMVLISDGITYIFNSNEEPTSIITTQYFSDAQAILSSQSKTLTGHGMKYALGTDISNSNMADFLGKVAAMVENDNGGYFVNYNASISDQDPSLTSNRNEAGNITLDRDKYLQQVGENAEHDVDKHANNVETALYYSAKTYDDMVSSGYHCYAVFDEDKGNQASYPWGKVFMDYLAGEENSVSFENIQNDIFYFLDAGTQVKDVIGYNNEANTNEPVYDFDFVNDAQKN